MAKRYARINWQDAPSTATPRNAANLNKMDKGIDDLDNAIEDLYGTKLDKANIANNLVTTEAGFALDARQGKILNDNLGDIKFTASGHSFDASIDITLTAGIYLVTTQRMVGGNEAGMYIVSATGTIFQITAIKAADTAITLSSSGLTLTINNASGVSVAYSIIRLLVF